MSKYRVCIERGCRRKAIDDTTPSPKEYVGGKSITLFGYTLLLYKETVDYLCDYCSDCLRDRHQARDRDIFDSGYNQAIHDVEQKGY